MFGRDENEIEKVVGELLKLNCWVSRENRRLANH